MRATLMAIGFLVLATGLLWIGQGTGVILWPADSFMLTDVTWAWIGGAVGLAGIGLIRLGLRRR